MTRLPTRTAALWIPDWSVLAAMAAQGLDAHTPAATHDNRRVVDVSAMARAQGVRRGMRRRRARECCPELVLLDVDDTRDAREFEPVALAAETVVSGLEISRPGLLLLPAAGASRFHGSDTRLAEALVVRVAERTGHECQVGVADGILAAILAARESRVVEGSAAAYLAPLPTGVLVFAATTAQAGVAVRELVHLLGRLGVHSLGDLVAMPADMIMARFGDLGAWAHRLARGEDLRPPARRRVEPDIAVATDLDPPAERVDVATFAARRLAEELHDQLIARSLSAGRLRITVRTTEGGELERHWRLDGIGGLSPARLTDRVRWQLEGWLTATSLASKGGAGGLSVPAGAPLVRLALAAEEVVPGGTEQPRLWGASSGEDVRAHRALGRVQGLLGGDAVLMARLQGGRDVRDQVHLTPFGEEQQIQRDPDLPWPGQLPKPRPATVLAEPQAADVVDVRGRTVVLDARLAMSAPPARVHWPPGFHLVRDWAGPWPLAERWWGPTPQRRGYLQVLLDDGTGLLLASTQGRWTVEGVYD